MRISTILVTTAAAGAALILSTGPAMAGEITGNGQPPPGSSPRQLHLRVLRTGGRRRCRLPRSRRSTAAELGAQQGGFGATPAERKASGFQPGDSCNGHSGFLVNPPPETP